MENIKDFEIQQDEKKMIIRYTGSNPKIDKCYSHLSSNFVVYHFIQSLQNINIDEQETQSCPNGCRGKVVYIENFYLCKECNKTWIYYGE